MKVKPLDDRVLVLPVEQEEKVGSIIIPDSAKEKPMVGKVVAVGTDKEIQEIIKINDQVIYHHGGDIDGFTSLLVLLPESEGLIILLSNEQDKSEERYQIMETIIKNEF